MFHKFDIRGYRKWSVALISLGVPSLLLVLGYDVAKLSWLSTPLAAFFAANLIENINNLIKKSKED